MKFYKKHTYLYLNNDSVGVNNSLKGKLLRSLHLGPKLFVDIVIYRSNRYEQLNESVLNR